MNDPKFIKQTISYAYNKGVTWAVLTNFQHLRVFNAQKTEPCISLESNQYEADFERLWLLSRESLTSGLLNQEAVKWGVLPVPIPIEKRLFAQMRLWREQLFNQIFRYNDKMGLKPEDVDEIIQKLFHRLIFIRTAEDRGIEEKGLLALLHQWNSAGAKGRLLDVLRQLFIEYDGYYDSELFDQKLHHLLDNPEIFVQNDVIESILRGLYEIPGSMASYNFNDIDADVLGAVYEQYLGHVAEVIKQRAKEAQAQMDLGITTQSYVLTAKKERRKEQGIYYTPKIITDFIVKETVGRYLQENSGYPDKLHNIKILDPACGSGSFLIRAYDELLKYHAQELNKPLEKLDQWERLPILTNSIFGVDLDKQAVEITRLNLLLRSLAHREPLPFLGDNIKRGNSLISGNEEDLKKYFGADWPNQHPFSWQDNFPNIMGKGGFDIVIGNPPYIRQEQLGQYKPFWQKEFECYDGVADIYVYFFERGIQLLKEGGFLAYISSNKYFRAGYGRKLREFLAAHTNLVEIVDFGELPVFSKAATFPAIVITRKKRVKVQCFTYAAIKELSFSLLTEEVKRVGQILDDQALRGGSWTLIGGTAQVILEKIRKAGVPLGKYVDGKVYFGLKTGFNEAFVIDRVTRDQLIEKDAKSEVLIKPFVFGDDVRKFRINFRDNYLILIPKGWTNSHSKGAAKPWEWMKQNYSAIAEHLEPFAEKAKKRLDQGDYWWELRACEYYDDFHKPKIVYPDIAKESRVAFDENGLYLANTIYFIPSNDFYLLALLNSNLVFEYMRRSAAVLGDPDKKGRLRWFRQDVMKIPIRTVDLNNPEERGVHDRLVGLVQKILAAQQSRRALSSNGGKNSDDDVSNLERELDQLVYQLYGLTENEIAIIESSVK